MKSCQKKKNHKRKDTKFHKNNRFTADLQPIYNRFTADLQQTSQNDHNSECDPH